VTDVTKGCGFSGRYMETQELDRSGLKKRGIGRLASTILILGGLLFISAGSLRFWQGWLFLFLMVGFWTYFFVAFLNRDPQLLERRLQAKEIHREQKIFHELHSTILIVAFIVAALDFRFGWTQARGGVPVSLVLAAHVLVVVGYWIVFWTMKTNSFAASIIKVEEDQRVIEVGPYAWVRHPMYLGMSITELALPLALGSYVALPVFALLVPSLIYRLIYEERTLCKELRGYSEYCTRTRFRIVPGIW
jgi:protein-S-isoprenylcysteine O-methyltransferase Ste14